MNDKSCNDSVASRMSEVSRLAADFIRTYDATGKDLIWQQQSNQFRQFWDNRILAEDSEPLTDNECDAVIRILDRNARGNTRN